MSDKCGWNITCAFTHTHTPTHNYTISTYTTFLLTLLVDMFPRPGVQLKVSDVRLLSEKYLWASRINGLSPHPVRYCQLSSVMCKAEKCRKAANQSIFCAFPVYFFAFKTYTCTVIGNLLRKKLLSNSMVVGEGKNELRKLQR